MQHYLQFFHKSVGSFRKKDIFLSVSSKKDTAKKSDRNVSRVLFPPKRAAIIYLCVLLPKRSKTKLSYCHKQGNKERAALIRACALYRPQVLLRIGFTFADSRLYCR